MVLGDRIDALRSLLTREQWATVLVLAGASLLVFPPAQPGIVLLGRVVRALLIAFVLVLVVARVRPLRNA